MFRRGQLAHLTADDYQIDQTALSLYPADGPPDSKPVAITGDGNCLYRCMSLLATGDEKLCHVDLCRLTMDELFRHAEKYAESIIERA